MTDYQNLRLIVVDLADANDTVDLSTVNIVLLTVPQYSNRSIDDIIRVYFDDTKYYTYVVDSIVGSINIKITKDQIRKQDYNI